MTDHRKMGSQVFAWAKVVEVGTSPVGLTLSQETVAVYDSDSYEEDAEVKFLDEIAAALWAPQN
jgi:hypothetical protein